MAPLSLPFRAAMLAAGLATAFVHSVSDLTRLLIGASVLVAVAAIQLAGGGAAPAGQGEKR
jgi:hypothetical protein